MPPASSIVLATANPHKVQELAEIFAPSGISLLCLTDLPGHPFPEPAETGTTFEHNATIKALAYAKTTGRLCLADDSGLEIDALGGQPGVISSHYCTAGREAGMDRPARDAANNILVLRKLDGVPTSHRTARFVCVMALARPGQLLASSRGTFEGRIGTPPEVPTGVNGFGYDPLFLVPPAFNLTSAQLSPEQKHALSHRGKAAREMVTRISALRLNESP